MTPASKWFTVPAWFVLAVMLGLSGWALFTDYPLPVRTGAAVFLTLGGIYLVASDTAYRAEWLERHNKPQP